MKKFKYTKIIFLSLFIVVTLSLCFLFTNETKTKVATKDIKLTESKKDTTWQKDFKYILDKNNKRLIIDRYIGNSKTVVIQGKSVIDGVEYTTELVNYNYRRHYINKLFPNVENLTIGDGVIMPQETYRMFNELKLKKLVIGNVVFPKAASMGKFANVSEEVDISGFDMTNLENRKYMFGWLTEHGTKEGEYSKITLGEKTIMKGAYPYSYSDTNFILNKAPGNGYWQKQGTDLIYLPRELTEVYDGKTMKGTYIHSYGNYISYNSNGGAGYVTAQLINTNGNTKLRKNTFERYGYKFIGWNTASDGTGTSYVDNESINISETTTLYAQWEKVADNAEYTDVTITLGIEGKDVSFIREEDYYSFELVLEVDGVEYAEPIQVISYDIENNSSYGFKYKRPSFDKYGYSTEYNQTISIGPTKKIILKDVPVGAKYKLRHVMGYADAVRFANGDSVNGTIKKNGVIDISMVPNTIDLTITQRIIGIDYGVALPVILKLSSNIETPVEVKYTGAQTGTLKLDSRYGKRTTPVKFMLKNGESIVIKDLPIGFHWEFLMSFTSNEFKEECYIGEYKCNTVYKSPNFNPDTSGDFGGLYYYKYNLTVDSIVYPTYYHGYLTIKKDLYENSNPGLEMKEYSFLVTAYKDKKKEETISGIFPYKIINSVSKEVIKEDDLTIDEKGQVIVKIKPGEEIQIGTDEFNGTYSDITLQNYGVIPYGTVFDIKEVEEENYESCETTIDLADNISNVYTCTNKRKISKLSISKDIDDSISKDEEFKFKIKFNDKSDLTKHNFTYKTNNMENEETVVLENNEYLFTLKGGETIEFNNLFKGMEYEVEELDADEYLVNAENNKGTIKEGENKVKFINKKANYDGNLTLTKKIKGKVDKNLEFEFKIKLLNVVLNDEHKEYKYTGDKEGTLIFDNNEATIKLKGGESITIESLPMNIEYEVTEISKGDYKTTSENSKGRISKDTKVEFINYKDTIFFSPNTGDNIIIFIVLGIVSVISIVLVTTRLRKGNN